MAGARPEQAALSRDTDMTKPLRRSVSSKAWLTG